jgi:hypothetical protein
LAILVLSREFREDQPQPAQALGLPVNISAALHLGDSVYRLHGQLCYFQGKARAERAADHGQPPIGELFLWVRADQLAVSVLPID